MCVEGDWSWRNELFMDWRIGLGHRVGWGLGRRMWIVAVGAKDWRRMMTLLAKVGSNLALCLDRWARLL